MTDARQISTTFCKSACRITKYVMWNVLIIKSNYKTHLPNRLFHKIWSWLTEIVLQNRRKWKAVIMTMKLIKLKIISLLLLWTVFFNLEKYFVYELRSGNHLQRTNSQTVCFDRKSMHVRGRGRWVGVGGRGNKGSSLCDTSAKNCKICGLRLPKLQFCGCGIITMAN